MPVKSHLTEPFLIAGTMDLWFFQSPVVVYVSTIDPSIYFAWLINLVVGSLALVCQTTMTRTLAINPSYINLLDIYTYVYAYYVK